MAVHVADVSQAADRPTRAGVIKQLRGLGDVVKGEAVKQNEGLRESQAASRPMTKLFRTWAWGFLAWGALLLVVVAAAQIWP